MLVAFGGTLSALIKYKHDPYEQNFVDELNEGLAKLMGSEKAVL